jgi:catechol 2,3-dioxygenase-like lactoylglutathione lyase family enzyme
VIPGDRGRLLGLGHVTLRSADFERTERFYCDLLGLRIGPRPPIVVPGRWLYLGSRAVLHVLPRRSAHADTDSADTDPRGAHGTFDHLALDAQGLAAFEQRLHAAGQKFERRRLADTAVWQLFLTDPDGATVELCFAGDDPPGRAAQPGPR